MACDYYFVDLDEHFAAHGRRLRHRDREGYLARARQLVEFDLDELWDCRRSGDGDMMLYHPSTEEFVVFSDERQIILTYFRMAKREAIHLWQKEGCQPR